MIYVLENVVPWIPWDFKIDMDHLISVGRLDLVLIHKKKITYLLDFVVSK